MEIQSGEIYKNSLIFDDIDNNKNFYYDNEIYQQNAQKNQKSSLNDIQQQHNKIENSNIYENTESLIYDNKKEKGRVLHLLKNFTEEMKIRWNMSEMEIRIHNFLDENHVCITDPMQKQFDYYQKTKSQIITSIVLQQYASDDDELVKEMKTDKIEIEEDIAQQPSISLNLSNSGQKTFKNRLLQKKGTLEIDDIEEERNNSVQNLNDNSHNLNKGNRGTQQSSIAILDSFSTNSSLQSQFSLQTSSIFVKRSQSKQNSLVIQPQSSLQHIDDDDSI